MTKRVTRRGVLAGTAALFAGYGLGFGTRPALHQVQAWKDERFARRILPYEPVATPVVFGDVVPRLIEAGVIDPDKMVAHQQRRAQEAGMPAPLWTQKALRSGQVLDEPLVISIDEAPYLLDFLWAVGLATRMEVNKDSPVAQAGDRYASTGGWRLGKAPKGGAYFNSVQTVALTGEQESLVRAKAGATYRPCCDNSAFVQDCNHGSAMLGFYQLAAAQGLDGAALDRFGRLLNAAWYPQEHLMMAKYWERVRAVPWASVPDRQVLDFEMASISGFRRNVIMALQHLDGPAEARPSQAGPQRSAC